MLSVRSGAAVGLIVQVALLVALALTVGLSPSGWVVGLACGVVLNVAVARGLARAGADALLGPADLVTLTRATLACGVAALVADSYLGQPATTALVALAVVALVLDAVDGWVARQTRTSSRFGTRFDGEVDAFLILVLSVYVARSVGWWVLVIGAMRYVFAVVGWGLPWLRAHLPPRYWRKVVAATQGIVLTFAAADVAPDWLTYGALLVAVVLLSESFGRDVWWLWRHRSAEVEEPAEAAEVGTDVPVDLPEPAPAVAGTKHRGVGSRPPAVVAAVTNTLALLLVWFALVGPNQVDHVTAGAFLRIPIEGLAVVFLALVLPPWGRRIMAAVVGVVLGLLMVVKILDMGFIEALDRPFDTAGDLAYLGPAVGLLRDSIGHVAGTIAAVAVAVILLAVLVCMPLAVGRLTKLVARHHRWSVRAVTGLVVIWIPCAALGLQLGQGESIASTSAGRFVVGEVRAITTSMADENAFDAAAAVDPLRDSAESEPLAGLRGKDVLIAFVESYGRVAIEGSRSSPRIQALLDRGTSRLSASGYSARSAFLTSPTFGGLSWLAHATLQSGLWVDNERRHDRLHSSDRMTLSSAFGDAGWRSVALMPSNREEWPGGKKFYQWDEIYDRSDIKYAGPQFGFSFMPDQFAMQAFQRQVLARRDRMPVMAELSLSSSHAPWAPLPRMLPWNRLGDGSVYERIYRQGRSAQEVWRDPDEVKAAYSRSIVYCLNVLISYVERYGDDDLVLILLGDHQPSTVVSGHGGSHDVPITLITRDPAVMDRISGWGWQEGMRPDSRAPVWPMDAFRDRFLAAYTDTPASPPLPTRPAPQRQP
ncbi:MAG TPA: CDP-alcohol phosphatidyltransferase family protein [Nocardioidaceae bacterium]|nr:CDP-alcohol phosphatidyltransferase family protein [Nocardioidaceae bacterium]